MIQNVFGEICLATSAHPPQKRLHRIVDELGFRDRYIVISARKFFCLLRRGELMRAFNGGYRLKARSAAPNYDPGERRAAARSVHAWIRQCSSSTQSVKVIC